MDRRGTHVHDYSERAYVGDRGLVLRCVTCGAVDPEWLELWKEDEREHLRQRAQHAALYSDDDDDDE